jgi:hypothetical protein
MSYNSLTPNSISDAGRGAVAVAPNAAYSTQLVGDQVPSLPSDNSNVSMGGI